MQVSILKFKIYFARIQLVHQNDSVLIEMVWNGFLKLFIPKIPDAEVSTVNEFEQVTDQGKIY